MVRQASNDSVIGLLFDKMAPGGKFCFGCNCDVPTRNSGGLVFATLEEGAFTADVPRKFDSPARTRVRSREPHPSEPAKNLFSLKARSSHKQFRLDLARAPMSCTGKPFLRRVRWCVRVDLHALPVLVDP